MKGNVHCESFPGATVVTITEKLKNKFDLTNIDSLVVYCGGNDAANGSDINQFGSQYTELIKYVQSQNSQCELYLCNTCPRGDAMTCDVNDVIKDLSSTHRAKYIDTNAAFYDSRGNLRDHFYGPRDLIHLSRSGTKRLLGTIDQHITIVNNFNESVYGSRTNQSMSGRALNNDKPQYMYQQNFHTSSQDYNIWNRNSRQMDTYHPATTDYIQDDGNYPNDRIQYQQRENQWEDVSRSERQSVKQCMKCGLTNHMTEECKHAKQVQCFHCKYFGHKDSRCWNR